MNEYLITDALTGRQTWTAGATLADALRGHGNARRAEIARTSAGWAGRFKPLPASAQCWHDNDGDIMRAGIGESYIRGLSSAVCRPVATHWPDCAANADPVPTL